MTASVAGWEELTAGRGALFLAGGEGPELQVGALEDKARLDPDQP